MAGCHKAVVSYNLTDFDHVGVSQRTTPPVNFAAEPRQNIAHMPAQERGGGGQSLESSRRGAYPQPALPRAAKGATRDVRDLANMR